MSRLIWIYVVCKSLLSSPMAVKELNKTLLLPVDVSDMLLDEWQTVQTQMPRSLASDLDLH